MPAARTAAVTSIDRMAALAKPLASASLLAAGIANSNRKVAAIDAIDAIALTYTKTPNASGSYRRASGKVARNRIACEVAVAPERLKTPFVPVDIPLHRSTKRDT